MQQTAWYDLVWSGLAWYCIDIEDSLCFLFHYQPAGSAHLTASQSQKYFTLCHVNALCMCMQVCVYVCMYVSARMYVFICINLPTSMYLCIYECSCVTLCFVWHFHML